MRFIDLTEKKFGRLVVIKLINFNKSGNSIWLCRCTCGTEKEILSTNLKKYNGTSSCGCLQKEIATKHHMCNKRIYNIWANIIQRCSNLNHPSYKDYGGRGIKICKKWLKFENFYKDVGDPPSDKHQIDRINNNKGYHPKNWRWTTHEKQMRNTRKNKIIKYNNEEKCLSELAREHNINHKTLGRRIFLYKLPIEEALNMSEKEVRQYMKQKRK